MASVNIGGGDDKFNRYKMPPVMGKVEGRGNGIKTRIVNCHEVAKALHRPPGYVCKFFGCELGAQTKINDDTGVYIVNGSFNNAKLAEVLQLFIKMFVLCENCNLPETDLKLKKNGDIKQICNACGSETICDMTHKLCTFISNNPPDGKKKSGGKKNKGDKNQRRAKKLAAAQEKQANGNGNAGPSDNSAPKETRRSAGEILPMGAEFDIGAAADAAAEELAVGNGTVATSTVGGIGGVGGAFSMMMSPDDQYGDDDGDDDGVEWSVDTSKEAQEARLVELGVNLAVLERGAKDEEEPLALKLRDYIDAGKKASKVLTKAEKLFGEERVVHAVMAASVVGENKENIAKSVEDRAVPILERYGTPMDKDSQMEYCDFLDIYGEDKNVRAVLAHILKKGFDADLLEEEVIFKWYRKNEGRKDVREAVKIYVDWLENAEEESESESE